MATQLVQRDDLGEVRVDSGYGRVTTVDPPKGRNAQVHIDAEGLKLPITGWVDTTDRPLYQAALDAQADGRRVFYAVECHRTSKCAKPLDTPLADLSNMEKVKDVVELTIVDGAGRAVGPVTASEASTVPVNATGGDVTADEAPAPDAPSGPPARQTPTSDALCDQSLAGSPARRVNGVAQHVECPTVDHPPVPIDAGELDPFAPSTTDASAAPEVWPCPLGCGVEPYHHPRALTEHMAQFHPDELAIVDAESAGTSSAPAGPPMAAGATTDGKRGPRITEPKPWEPYIVLAGGATAVNLGSYAMQACEGMVLLAHDLLLEKARTAATLDGVPFAPPTPGQLRSLARRLLTAADLAQAQVRPDGHANRMEGSHTRCRAAVRVALEAHPVPWGAVADELDAWVLELAGYAAAIVEVARGLHANLDDLP